ncbi:TPA: hypothetical protein SBC13_001779 [Campylobacter jejuni]|nr:hypothetical protein [Campylobacter jejuni]
MNLLVKNIKKTLKQYGHNFSSLKKENFSLSEELAFVFYSKYAQILIPFAPSAVKEFYDENDADILDYFIERIVKEALKNIVCIWENKESIENANPELPICIDLINANVVESVNSFDNECEQEILDFFNENNYELCYIIENNVKYYFLKDLELDIIEKNYASSVVSKNAFQKDLKILCESIKKDIELSASESM